MRRIVCALGAAALAAGCTVEVTADVDEPVADAVAAINLERLESDADFETTLARLRSAIDQRGLNTFAVVDHAAGAASVDLEMAPATLVIFGNPRAGTPLMNADIRMGLELPLKMLVYEQNGAVYVTYRDVAETAAGYGIAADTGPLPNVKTALAAIAGEATTATED